MMKRKKKKKEEEDEEKGDTPNEKLYKIKNYQL